MHVHGGLKVLSLSSVGDGFVSRLLLLRRNFFFEEAALLHVINHHEDTSIILLDEPLFVEIVEVGVELVGLVDGLVHGLDLPLQLLDLSHLSSKLSLLQLLPSFGLSDFLLAPAPLQIRKTENG